MKRTGLLLLLAACGGEEPMTPAICDAASLQTALDSASSGDRIAMGACRIEGDFVVRSGVTLAGAGATSVIAGSDIAIEVEGNGAAIEDLSVAAGARAGIVLREGRASVSRVHIEAPTGIALGAEGLDSLRLDTVSALGPIDASNEGQVPYPPDRTIFATHGIVAVNVADLDLVDVTANGFAGAGVVIIDSSARWERGNADANLGLGLHVQGGSAELIDVGLDQTFRGTWGIETYGGAFTASAAIDSTNLTADDNWYGLLQDGGSARHRNISAIGNQNAGLWAQFTTSFDIDGTVRDNDFAGIVAFQAEGVAIHDSTIETTHEVLRPTGETGTVIIGDGIQLVDSADGARLVDLELTDNERVGLLIELRGGSYSAMEISNVRISQSVGNAAVIQHGFAPNDWDSGIIRNGVTADADRAVTDLDFADVVGPCGRPREDVRDLGALGL
jgi:hypothetical protein